MSFLEGPVYKSVSEYDRHKNQRVMPELIEKRTPYNFMMLLQGAEMNKAMVAPVQVEFEARKQQKAIWVARVSFLNIDLQPRLTVEAEFSNSGICRRVRDTSVIDGSDIAEGYIHDYSDPQNDPWDKLLASIGLVGVSAQGYGPEAR